MTPRAQLSQLMGEVESAADNAERALRRLQARGVVGTVDERASPVTPFRAGLVLVSFVLAAKTILLQD